MLDSAVNTKAEKPDELALPATVVTEWLQPFLDYLAKERRYSAYTVRNYRQAMADFHQW